MALIRARVRIERPEALFEVGPGQPTGAGPVPIAINRLRRGNRAVDQSGEDAAATSGQSVSTIETKFEPLNGLPTTSVATSAMLSAS